jgi:hypothetical protein
MVPGKETRHRPTARGHGKRVIVRANAKLTAFLELESEICAGRVSTSCEQYQHDENVAARVAQGIIRHRSWAPFRGSAAEVCSQPASLSQPNCDIQSGARLSVRSDKISWTRPYKYSDAISDFSRIIWPRNTATGVLAHEASAYWRVGSERKATHSDC